MAAANLSASAFERALTAAPGFGETRISEAGATSLGGCESRFRVDSLMILRSRSASAACSAG